MSQTARQHFTFRDYIDLEELSGVKHEFLGGQAWAMAGGWPDHARLAMNIGALLLGQLRDKRCAVFDSDLRIRVKATGLATYPDVTVICGSLELDPEDPKRHTVTNPKVIVEVLSPSTRTYDCGEKLEHYRQIESLEEVALVAHDRQRVDVWRRTHESWTLVTFEEGATAQLSSIGCELPLRDVYRDPLAS